VAAFIVQCTARELLELNKPQAADITRVLKAVSLGGGQWGDWVGPVPRITRVAVIGDAFYTSVAWVYQTPDEAFAQEHSSYIQGTLKDNVTAALQTVSTGFGLATIGPWSEAVNGALAWWQSGDAGVTQTRDEYPELAGRTDAAENPIGPTSTASHPTTVADLMQHAASTVSTSLAWILIPVAVIAGLYYLGPVIQTYSGRTAVRELRAARIPVTRTPEARKNPRHRYRLSRWL
jgi:hypothetical protein